jgi:hypothetical protein
VRVTIDGHDVVFAVPRSAPPADALVRRAGRAFRKLRSAVSVEWLASSPANAIVTTWKLEAPDRLSYSIRGGAQAVLVGARRWDRSGPSAPWQRSTISPLEVPQPVWGDAVLDARLLASDGRIVTVAWANPSVPAWFTARFDRRTLLPLDVHMTAAAHFMVERYVSFNRKLGIRPPR